MYNTFYHDTQFIPIVLCFHTYFVSRYEKKRERGREGEREREREEKWRDREIDSDVGMGQFGAAAAPRELLSARWTGSWPHLSHIPPSLSLSLALALVLALALSLLLLSLCSRFVFAISVSVGEVLGFLRNLF